MRQFVVNSLGFAYFVLLSHFSSAEIRYTDVAADTIKCGYNDGCFSVDLDGNGVIDYNVVATNNSSYIMMEPYSLTWGNSVQIVPLYENLLLGENPYSLISNVLEENDPVNGSYPWVHNDVAIIFNGYKLNTYVPGLSPLPSTFEKYKGRDVFLGLQFYIGSETHFGWIKIYIHDCKTFMVKSFAYETEPGKAIRAGVERRSFEVFQAANSLEIQFSNTFSGEISLVSSSGEYVASFPFSGDDHYSLPLSGIVPGVYTVRVFNREFVESKKISIL